MTVNNEYAYKVEYMADIKADDVCFYRDADQAWRWRRTDGANGKIIGASSEGFSSFKNALANFNMNLSASFEIDVEV